MGGGAGLDSLGVHLLDIQSYRIEPQMGGHADFFVEDLGEGVDAVAMVISALPASITAGQPAGTTVPYSYTYSLVPENVSFWSGFLMNRETMPANTAQWVLGDLEIEPSGRLTIEEGAVVFFCGDSSGISVQGGDLLVEGSAGNPVRFLPSNLPQYRNPFIDHLAASGSNTLQASHLEVSSLLTLDIEDSDCRLDNLALSMADTIANAVRIEGNQAGIRDLSASTVSDVNIVRLGGATEIYDCTLLQRRVYFPMLSPYPLVEVRDGEVDIRSSTLTCVERGLLAGVLVSDAPSVHLDGVVEIRSFDSSSKKSVGLEAAGGAQLEADSIRVSGLAYAIKLRNSATLHLDHSYLFLEKYGVVAYGGDRDVVLGDVLDPSHPGENYISIPSQLNSDCPGAWNAGLQWCFEDSVHVVATRIMDLSQASIVAQNNQWGSCDHWNDTFPGGMLEDYGVDCICPEEFFKPDPDSIAWLPRMPQYANACQASPGNPGFAVIAASEAASKLAGAWPNPFNGPITFLCRAAGSDACLSIFDIAGRRIAELKEIRRAEGFAEYQWNGRDGRGHPASSGVYFYRLEHGAVDFQGKVVYVK